MKHSLKHTSPTIVIFTITLDAKDLAEIRPVTVAKLSSNLKVAGFRPGKVPVDIAERNLNQQSLETQLSEDAINQAMIIAINEHKFQVLDRPKVNLTGFEPKKSLTFTAEVEVLPEVKLGNYKHLTVKKVPVKVLAAEIDDVINRMRSGFAVKNDVTRPAKSGDEVIIDFEGRDQKGELVPGANGNDYPLLLGSKTFIPGFEDGIINKKAGQTFELRVTFPKNYHAEALKGAKVAFKVTLKQVKEVILPVLDEEFAKKCGPFKAAAELKADIKRELTAQKQQAENDKLKDSLIEQLVKASEVPVPASLAEEQMNHIERDTIQNLLYRGQTLEQYLESQKLTREQWREKELKQAAERRVQVGLVLAELSKTEKIEVSRDELDARHAEQLGQYTDPKLRAQFETPEARRNLANRVLTEKTVDRLVGLNS